MALPKKNRISNKKDIDRVFKEGRTVRGSFLFIRFVNNEKGYFRIAFMIPTKYVSLAVNRNKIRRMFFEELSRETSLLKKSYDIIVLVCKKTEKDRQKYLTEELRELLTKIQG